ncbi:MAG: glycosyltransferase family 4 protein [Candidatus Accumulibacter sp.]|nr:glycosyltransferase family 4 protein [Accumulibacter sp.]
MRTLLFSTLYPSAARPVHGIFVETRLRELLKTGEVETRVVAPVPWFPFRGPCFGDYGKFAETPGYEIRNDIEVHHPRYFLLPKVGMNMAPFGMARAALPTIRRLIAGGFDFDLIDAHYYYPDGVAAGMIAEKLGKPFVVTARGTDLTLIADYPRPRKLILDTAARASASIGVCQALMDRLAALGAAPEKLHVLRNGVDMERFQPVDRDEARRRLGLPPGQRILLSVGLLIERKGHHIAIEAMTGLRDDLLVIIGSGPELARLQKMAENLKVMDRVRFVEQVPNERLKDWYSAADALVLCSSREGWANVLLESMACGTPVVATDIPGTREVVSCPEAGMLMRNRNAISLVDAINAFFLTPTKRKNTRIYAGRYSWESTTKGQLELFETILTEKII